MAPFQTDEPASNETNAPEFTVSELSGAVKRTVEDAFGLVRVRGEVGRVSRPGSGHLYYDLKDEGGVLSAVTWKGQARWLGTDPEEGLEVVATGRLTTFARQSRYQMIVESLAPAGVGALMALLEKRKRQLEAEGLFAPERKRPLPFLPRVIGVVTSPSGAVIRDILHRLADRFPVHVVVWPVRVQGEGAAAEIAAAIRGFARLDGTEGVERPEVLIVARGGGSVEDLWAFNEEGVARAAAECPIPLISAVGHETDTTLIDFVADRRAPTPTAAAEMAVPVRAELIAGIDDRARRLTASALRLVAERRAGLRSAARALPRLDALVAQQQQRFDAAVLRFEAASKNATRDRRVLIDAASARLAPALRGALLARRGDLRAVSGRLTLGDLRLSYRRAGERTRQLARRLGAAFVRKGRDERRLFASKAHALRPELLERRIADGREVLARRAERSAFAQAARLERRAGALAHAERLLSTLSYTATLERGFALVRHDDDTLVRRASEIEPGERVAVEFADGRVAALTGERAPRARDMGERAKKGRRGPGKRGTEQGSLF